MASLARFGILVAMMTAIGCGGGTGPAKKEEPKKDPPKATGPSEETLKDAAWCAMMLNSLFLARANRESTGMPDEGVAFGPTKGYSWRVPLLPFMEAQPAYEALALQAGNFAGPLPKDAKVPEVGVFLLQSQKGKGPKTVFRRVLLPGAKGAPFVVVESSELVDWVKPGDELTVAEGKPLPKLGGNFKGGFFALCADGKVRFLPDSLDAAGVRKALLTGEGGTVIPDLIEDREKAVKKVLGG